MIEIIRKLDMRILENSNSDRKVRFLECKCTYCNSIFESRADTIKNKKSCGCLNRTTNVTIGEAYGKVTVLKDLGRYDKNKTGNKQRYVLVKCECGEEFEVIYNSLKTGNTKSCGCYHVETSTENMNQNRKDWSSHGKSRTKIYKVWTSMKDRCNNENNSHYSRYGGRGISVTEQWINKDNGFESFYEWAMNNGYQEGLSIDRIENDGNYEPSNCQWITLSENSKKIKIDREKRKRNEVM